MGERKLQPGWRPFFFWLRYGADPCGLWKNLLLQSVASSTPRQIFLTFPQQEREENFLLKTNHAASCPATHDLQACQTGVAAVRLHRDTLQPSSGFLDSNTVIVIGVALALMPFDHILLVHMNG